MNYLRVLLAFLTLQTTACASRSGDYERELDRARALERKGQLEPSSSAYGRAASLAKTPEDHVEALYRQAQAYRRAHEFSQAIKLLEDLAGSYPESSRAPRALLDKGRILERMGHPKRAAQVYTRLIKRYPTAPVASSAVTALGRLQTENRSAAFRQMLEQTPPGELEQLLRLRLGQALAEEGAIPQAISTLERLARDYPLPRSGYSDEALLLSASLRRKEGDAQGCVAVLESLVSQDTRADIVGSYVRASYPQGLWLMAEVLRDDLANPAEAEKAFLRLAAQYPDSLLADDALWQAGALALSRDDEKAACQRAQQLKARRPTSRYASCLSYLCPNEEPAPAQPRCTSALHDLPDRHRPRAQKSDSPE